MSWLDDEKRVDDRDQLDRATAHLTRHSPSSTSPRSTQRTRPGAAGRRRAHPGGEQVTALPAPDRARPGPARIPGRYVLLARRGDLAARAAASSDDLLVAYPTADRAALRALAADEAARQHITVTDRLGRPPGLHRRDARRRATRRSGSALTWTCPGGRCRTARSCRSAPGGRRCAPRREAALFAETVLRRPGFSLVGVLGYEGQIAGLGDAPPGRPVRARVVQAMQARSAAELRERRTEAVRRSAR